jgi:fermentation-respiration switch protein FrsA (DUF1100 family)
MTAPRLLLVLVAAVLGFAAGCLAIENKLVFHPAHPTADDDLPPEPPVRDLTLRTADGIPVHARWCPRTGAAGAVIYCHGNGGNLEIRARPVRELGRALGESVLIFDYPGYGTSGGTVTEASCYAAADAAYDWLTRERGMSPERILIFGESLGGGVAVDLASRQPHRALVLVKTFASIPDVAADHVPLLPVRWLVTNQFDNAAKIGRCVGPVLIAQGDCDHVVPFEHGLRLAKAAGSAAQFVVLKGSDHNDPLPPEFYAELREFVDRKAPLGTREDATGKPAG